MKATSSFKMPKSVKRMLSNTLDPHLRGSLRRDWVKALVESNVKTKSSKEDRNKD